VLSSRGDIIGGADEGEAIGGGAVVVAANSPSGAAIDDVEGGCAAGVEDGRSSVEDMDGEDA
jgi:hypothetical protein